jgi:hypothetical protein
LRRVKILRAPVGVFYAVFVYLCHCKGVVLARRAWLHLSTFSAYRRNFVPSDCRPKHNGLFKIVRASFGSPPFGARIVYKVNKQKIGFPKNFSTYC